MSLKHSLGKKRKRKILLDTNAYGSFLAGDRAILDVLAQSDTVFMSIFVLGELYAGFRGGKKEKQNKKILEDFLRKPTIKILNATLVTAEIFGCVKQELKVAGTPDPYKWSVDRLSRKRNRFIIDYLRSPF